MADKQRRKKSWPAARVLADLLAQSENTLVRSRLMGQMEYPVLISGHGLSIEEAYSAIYPIATIVRERRAAGRRPHVRLGRGDGSDILVPADPSVSKRHAILIGHDDGAWTFANLGRAATRLDGQRLEASEQVDLRGEVVPFVLGGGVEFTFVRERAFKMFFSKLLSSRMSAQLMTTEVQSAEAIEATQGTTVQTRAILRAVEPARDATVFFVYLQNALIEEAERWTELIELVEDLADEIIQIDAVVPGASPKKRTLYCRDR